MDQPEELAKQIAGQAIWWRANADHTDEVIAYCSIISRKYEVAARYPWLEVAPDPPMPYWSGVTGPPPDEPVGALGKEHAELDAGRVAEPAQSRTK